MTNSYLDVIALAILRAVEPDADLADDELLLYRVYAVLLLAKGQNVTAEDVHNAWAVWASRYEPNHPNIRPFGELPAQVQSKDQPYVDAIHDVARGI